MIFHRIKNVLHILEVGNYDQRILMRIQSLTYIRRDFKLMSPASVKHFFEQQWQKSISEYHAC